ncbi:histidine phosphatase family protein [Brevibacillus brevis]|uniref:histidine phosphatase family protein n=1 Tax=Brevibacillus brevis TaxID=1393 RepID=UPI000D0F1B80|nr:histidine phosphatase family protein [Brevibacillus brevis]PSJ69475.1 histidine phosphatase family protein [Brevibacillus brevis]RED21198.1 2,3-bisphosphoglycerate-dependent phosphoglycerate mutase [Brevibacillus brevis]GEC92782.1 phosphoglycerate mutase [Brevibacillus brevis]VEF90099.1 bifunctional RNase H/acid phosphatase [Brevibacillus brevis]
MRTHVYMVRHAESPYIQDQEETRGLSEKGLQDAQRVAGILKDEQIDVFVSSPYARAIKTIEAAAKQANQEIKLEPGLRERELGAWGEPFEHFVQAIEYVFANREFAFAGGESNVVAGERGLTAFQEVLDHHRGKKVAVGIHGNIMTIIMNHYDSLYDFSFWKKTSMPDIYKLSFEEDQLIQVERLWNDKDKR